MIRLASLFWLALVAVTGFATFKVKYAVQDIEDALNKVRRHTVAEQQEIHILRAEWTSLNQPERLADLNRGDIRCGGDAGCRGPVGICRYRGRCCRDGRRGDAALRNAENPVDRDRRSRAAARSPGESDARQAGNPAAIGQGETGPAAALA